MQDKKKQVNPESALIPTAKVKFAIMYKEAEWRNQMKPIRDPSKKAKPSWVVQHANKVFGLLNTYFLATGICIVVAGIYFHDTMYAEMYENGSNWRLTTGFMIFGWSVIVTSVVGQIAYKRNIKCLLLFYWIMGFIAFIIDIVFAVQFLGAEDIEKKGSEWWDNYDTDFRIEVQEEYSCCGYYSNTDRQEANCDQETDPDQPCADKVRSEMNDKLFPALLFFFICGIALGFSMLVTGKIVCRRTYSRKTPGVSGTINQNVFIQANDDSDKEDDDRL